MGNDSESRGPGRPSKVATLIDEYELTGLGAELEQRWTADDDRMSLRELAEYFNERLLQQEMTDAGVQALDGESANTYRLLTGDDVSAADKTRIKRRLKREGVDIDGLTDNFVSYQAIRTYLQNHRDAEYSRSKPQVDRTRQTVEQLRGRTVNVTESRLKRLQEADQIRLGTFRTLVDVRVVCEECGNQYGITELLERGGCDCTSGEIDPNT